MVSPPPRPTCQRRPRRTPEPQWLPRCATTPGGPDNARECLPRSAAEAMRAPSFWRRHPSKRSSDTLAKGGGAQTIDNLIKGGCDHEQVFPGRFRCEAGPATASCLPPLELLLPRDSGATETPAPQALSRLRNKRLVKREYPAQVSLQLLVAGWSIPTDMLTGADEALKVGWALRSTIEKHNIAGMSRRAGPAIIISPDPAAACQHPRQRLAACFRRKQASSGAKWYTPQRAVWKWRRPERKLATGARFLKFTMTIPIPNKSQQRGVLNKPVSLLRPWLHHIRTEHKGASTSTPVAPRSRLRFALGPAADRMRHDCNAFVCVQEGCV